MKKKKKKKIFPPKKKKKKKKLWWRHLVTTTITTITSSSPEKSRWRHRNNIEKRRKKDEFCAEFHSLLYIFGQEIPQKKRKEKKKTHQLRPHAPLRLLIVRVTDHLLLVLLSILGVYGNKKKNEENWRKLEKI